MLPSHRPPSPRRASAAPPSPHPLPLQVPLCLTSSLLPMIFGAPAFTSQRYKCTPLNTVAVPRTSQATPCKLGPYSDPCVLLDILTVYRIITPAFIRSLIIAFVLDRSLALSAFLSCSTSSIGHRTSHFLFNPAPTVAPFDTIHSLVSFSHQSSSLYDAARSVAGKTTSPSFSLLFPHFLLSPPVAYLFPSTRTRRINTPPCLSARQQ